MDSYGSNDSKSRRTSELHDHLKDQEQGRQGEGRRGREVQESLQLPQEQACVLKIKQRNKQKMENKQTQTNKKTSKQTSKTQTNIQTNKPINKNKQKTKKN